MLATISTHDLIARRIKVREEIELLNKQFNDKFIAPRKTEVDEIDAVLLERLNALGGGHQSIKTDAGTAYKSVITTPKIVDRDAYLDAVMENWDTWGSGILQLMAPKKEAVDEFLASTKQLPPGVEVTAFTRVNVRRS